jgi:hypothetical protein
LNAPDHFIHGQEIHIKPAQAREDEGEEQHDEYPKQKDGNRKKQVRQNKPSGHPQSDAHTPNTKNIRVNPRKEVIRHYEHQFVPNYQDVAYYDIGEYHQHNYYDERYSEAHPNIHQFDEGRIYSKPYGIQQGATRSNNMHPSPPIKQQGFTAYQTTAYNYNQYHPNSSPSDTQHHQNHDPLSSPVSGQRRADHQSSHMQAGILPKHSNIIGISTSYSPKARPQHKHNDEVLLRIEKDILKPEFVSQQEEKAEQPANKSSSAVKKTYSNQKPPSQNQEELLNNGQKAKNYQGSPTNNRQLGGIAYSPLQRSSNKHFSGLHQIPESESQQLSGDHQNQNSNRVSQTQTPVLQSGQGSELDDDVPQESQNLIEDFNYYGQVKNQQDAHNIPSPSNQPDSLRLINRNQLSNPNNFHHVGDSLMSSSGQYPITNPQNTGRYTSSSSNMILNSGIARQELLGNYQSVKPQFSHKQIIQSSQKPGYSMFAPNPTPVAPNFQRSNDGGSSSQIRNKPGLNSERTISNEELFQKSVNQLSPLQKPTNTDHYYQGNMQGLNYYGQITSMPSVVDPRTALAAQSQLNGYQTQAAVLQDQSSLNGRPQVFNAIYTRSNNPTKPFHRSEQAIGHSHSHGSWPVQDPDSGSAYPHQQPSGSTPFVDKYAPQSRRIHFDGNPCIPIDEDGDNDDLELQKATDF